MKNLKNIIKSILFICVFAFVYYLLFLYQPIQNSDLILLAPSFAFPFGTDSLGRNFLFRVAQGSFTSVLIAASVSTLSMLVCLCLGFFLILKLRFINSFIQSIANYVDIFPNFILIGLFFSWLKVEGLFFLVICMGLLNWIQPYRALKGAIQNTIVQDFYLASTALGASSFHLYTKHVLPNIKESIKTLFILGLSSAIIMEGAISLIGYGVQPPQTSLGVLFLEGWSQMSVYPWLITIPTTIYLILILLCTRFIKKQKDLDIKSKE